MTAKSMLSKNTLLFTALAAALFAAAPAFAQDIPPDTTVENDGSVPKDRLVDEYAGRSSRAMKWLRATRSPRCVPVAISP